jgi:hypothetical protein
MALEKIGDVAGTMPNTLLDEREAQTAGNAPGRGVAVEKNPESSV